MSRRMVKAAKKVTVQRLLLMDKLAFRPPCNHCLTADQHD